MPLSTPTSPPIVPPAPRWAILPLARGAPAEPTARTWLARQLGVGAGDLAIERDPRGRPRLGKPFTTCDTSWSHSGQHLLVALGHGLRVGIDLEWLRPRPSAMALARRFFRAHEVDWLALQPAAQRERAFLRLWCAKEAALKAHGHGLAFGLDRLGFIEHAGKLRLRDCDPALGDAAHWQLRELAPAEGYLGALAWRACGWSA